MEVSIFTGDCSVNLELLPIPLICPDLTNQPVSPCRKTYQHLAHLNLADTTDDASARVDVLIGADYYYEFVTGKVIRRRQGPIAIETKFGWVLSGLANFQSHTVSQSMGLVVAMPVLSASLDTQLQRFWHLESLGISSCDQSVYDRFERYHSRVAGMKYVYLGRSFICLSLLTTTCLN